MDSCLQEFSIVQLMNDDLRYSRDSLGKFFKILRLDSGYSLRALARKTGISGPHIYRMEKGETDFTLGTFVRLSSALGIPPGWAIDHGTFSDAAFFRDRLLAGTDLNPIYQKLALKGDGSKRLVAGFVGAACAVAAQLTRSSNPEVTLLRLVQPNAVLRDWFGPLVSKLKESISPRDNAHRLDALHTNGYAELIRIGVLSERKVITHLGYIIDRYRDSLEQPIGKIAHTALLVDFIPFAPDFPVHSELSFHYVFTSNAKHLLQEQVPCLPSSISELMDHVQKATEQRGSRAALAAALKIPAQRLNDWIHGRNSPNGKATLQLLKWVETEEAKNNTTKSYPGHAETRPGRKTPKRKIRSNEKPKSGQK